MEFAIHSDTIGSEKHLSSDGSWLEDLPEDRWIVGKSNPEKDLLLALFLFGTKLEITPPKVYSKIMNNFGWERNIPWQKVMPDHDYVKWTDDVLNKVSKALESFSSEYHDNVFVKACELLAALQPMKIHGKKWDYLASHDITGVQSSVIESFRPYKDGFTDKIEYNLNSTVTGRMTVKSGPEILTLNKELKSIIKSRYKGGKIVQFDYVSLEPRLALILGGYEVSDDIYSDINDLIFDNKFTRDIVKLSTLSVMYGSGAEKLSESIGLSFQESRGIISQLKQFFGVHKMSKELSNEYKKNKFIRNFFGRAIHAEDGAAHRLFSNYNQSSATDCANIGFWNIIQLWKGTRVIPQFLIHDNLALDFPPEMLTEENFEKTKEVGSKVPNLNGKLLLGYDML